jgi:NAD(P)-dependent dehydrogenase (short-subunit alcohol dehydrogenase family)
VIQRVVVGAAGQLGAAIADASYRRGDSTLAVDPLLEEVPSGIDVLRADASSPAFGEKLRAVLTGVSRSELILAGSRVPPLIRVSDVTGDDLSLALNDVVTTFRTMSMFAEAVKAATVDGSILVVSSVGARHPHRYMIGYDAARACLESLARSFALAYASYGITTRVMAVGPIAESATSVADGNLTEALVRLVPVGRYPRLDELAEAALALSSAPLDWANGHTVTLDGGLTVQLRPGDIERAPG